MAASSANVAQFLTLLANRPALAEHGVRDYQDACVLGGDLLNLLELLANALYSVEEPFTPESARRVRRQEALKAYAAMLAPVLNPPVGTKR